MPKKMIHTLEELKDLQALPLDFKVALDGTLKTWRAGRLSTARSYCKPAMAT